MHLGRVIGKFRLERRLGHGAMGDVFLGVHVELGSFVAIKILNPAACAEPSGVARFLNEARAVAAIDHEQIARVIDQDRLPDGTPYIVMEFVEGVTLRELLDERGPLGLRLTVELMLDVLSALAVAHARGIVHRDLKPENIRVTKSERAKILDFGIAKVLHDVPTPLTQQGMLVGTPYYMSPEQIGGGALDGRSDLYAVGVILFECVTGQRPFEGSTVVALLHRHLQEAPRPPRTLRPELPPALELAILRALEKAPTLRFGSAGELASALRGVLEALPADGPVVRRPSLDRTAATPALSRPDASTEDALQNTLRTPLTRRFRLAPSVLAVALLASGLLLWGVERVFSRVELPAAPVKAAPASVVAPRVEAAPGPVAPPPPSAAVVVVPEEVRKPQKGLRPPGPKRVEAQAPPPLQVEPPPGPESGPPAPTPPPAAPVARGVTLIETSSERTSLPVDFDARAFDALGYLPRAQALARARMSDAVLVTFNVSGLFSGDRVDLTLSNEFHADYYFRSPEKSVADPRLRDEDQDLPCLTYVVVSAKKTEVFAVSSSSSCHEKPLPPVRCSVSDAFRQARADGLTDSSKAMNLSWLSGGWFFDFGGINGSMSVACP